MGHYTPNKYLCEVVLNGEYIGIYDFTKGSISGDVIANQYTVAIEKNKSVIDLETLYILY